MSRKNAMAVIIVMVIVAIANSCSGRAIYSHYEQVDMVGWNMDSLLRYEVAIPDTTLAYDWAFRVRSTEAYPYENLWLFVQTDWLQDSIAESRRDTIEVYLLDDRGNRLGNEHNGYNDVRIDMPSAIRYASDTVHISVQQGMRDADIVGICAIGLEIKKL